MHIDREAIVAARQTFLGIDFDPLAPAHALASIQTLSRKSEFSYIVTPNVDHLIRLWDKKEQRFERAYDSAELILCDSRILAGLASMHEVHLPVVTGSDLTAELFKSGFRSGDEVAIIGSGEEVVAALKSRFPLPVYHHHIPPMGLLGNDVEMMRIVDFVAVSKAHYVLLAVGSPQSELVAHLIKKSNKATGVGLCIGASLEFLAGTKQRAPRWMQEFRLEWLFRLLSEPRRLAARYLLGAVKFANLYWRWRKGMRGLARDQHAT
jgi:N-acetylglucosaminyldiphosphoundecaprenol N-acetyl-beta-D-mannosaminyltransferase